MMSTTTKSRQIPNLGRALTILARAEAAEDDYHADVSAWGAPSECHADVNAGEAFRYRRARKHAEAVARRPYRVILREAEKRGCPMGAFSRRWNRLVAALHTHPHNTGRPL